MKSTLQNHLIKFTRLTSLFLILIMIVSVLPAGMVKAEEHSEATVAAAPSLSAVNKTLYIGGEPSSFTLTLKNAGDNKVTFKSSRKSVAKVSRKGKVTAVKAGTATITATCNGIDYTCTVTVKAPYFKTAEKTLEVGNTLKLKLYGDTAASYKSSDNSIATVSAEGIVTAKKEGTCKITAAGKYGSYTAKITVPPTPKCQGKLKHLKNGKIYVDLTKYPDCGFAQEYGEKTDEDVEEIRSYMPYIKCVDEREIFSIAGDSAGKKEIYDVGTYIVSSDFDLSILDFNIFWMFCKALELENGVGLEFYLNDSRERIIDSPYEVIYEGACTWDDVYIYSFRLRIK